MLASSAVEPEILPIHTRGLTKRYGATVALDGLDLDVCAGEVPPLPELDGVRAQVTDGRSVRFEVWGQIAPLIDALAGLPVVSLHSREPSLEDIFVHYYQPAGAHVDA
jgi:hypothetical protein